LYFKPNINKTISARHDGKPKYGPSYQYMYKSKASFKQFWNDVAKSANRKATAYVNKIGNVVGEENICHMWHDYFKTLYNSVPDNHDRDYVVNACSEVEEDVFECNFYQ